MKLEPYLFFDGRCDEAIEFYKRVLGAEVQMLMRFKESPVQQPEMVPPGSENKIMHAQLRVGETRVLMSDGECHGKPKFDGFSLSISAASDDEAKRVFTGLSEGGKVNMPLTKTFFSSSFGMVNDRFGVPWMVLVGK
jgi:PhnB protein